MSEAAQPAQPSTMVSAISHVGSAIVQAVPPPFLGLALINAIFIGSVLFFLHRVVEIESQIAEARLTVFSNVIDTCMQQVALQQTAILKSQDLLVQRHVQQ